MGIRFVYLVLILEAHYLKSKTGILYIQLRILVLMTEKNIIEEYLLSRVFVCV
jgi:hypothetical protein